MAKMSQECMDMVNNTYAAAIATCSKDGTPNVVASSMKQAPDPETIIISDQFFNKTLSNMKENPKAALSVWNDTSGFQIKGVIEYQTEGKLFESISAQVHEILSSMGFDFNSKGVAILHVEAVYSLTPGPEAGKQLS